MIVVAVDPGIVNLSVCAMKIVPGKSTILSWDNMAIFAPKVVWCSGNTRTGPCKYRASRRSAGAFFCGVHAPKDASPYKPPGSPRPSDADIAASAARALAAWAEAYKSQWPEAPERIVVESQPRVNAKMRVVSHAAIAALACSFPNARAQFQHGGVKLALAPVDHIARAMRQSRGPGGRGPCTRGEHYRERKRCAVDTVESMIRTGCLEVSPGALPRTGKKKDDLCDTALMCLAAGCTKFDNGMPEEAPIQVTASRRRRILPSRKNRSKPSRKTRNQREP